LNLEPDDYLIIFFFINFRNGIPMRIINPITAKKRNILKDAVHSYILGIYARENKAITREIITLTGLSNIFVLISMPNVAANIIIKKAIKTTSGF